MRKYAIDVENRELRRFGGSVARQCYLTRAELAYIDILANSKIGLDGVRRMTEIQNTS